VVRALLVVMLFTGTAGAQVFRPRGKTGAMHPVATTIVTAGAAVAKAPTPGKTPGPLAAKTAAKAPPHVAAKKPKHVAKKKSGDDDDVVVVDDDDDN